MGKEEVNKFLIGTSGWSYEDWLGCFYPIGLKPNKFLWYYSQYFNTVEINFSYYRMPNRYVMKSIVKNVPRDFIFTVKLNSCFTHQKDLKNPYAEIPLKERDEFVIAIDVLKEKGMLDTILSQFPQGFYFSQKNLEYVINLGRAFEGYNFAVEFRNNSWYNDIVYDVFRRENFTFVSVDEPGIEGLPPREFIVTNPIAYVRLHSRNKSNWYRGEKLRYDYFYSDDELREWVQKINLNSTFDKVYCFFNNCHKGSAVKNALRFKEILEEAYGI
ncbi:MAG: DUF72 domain-containing protein [Brevinematia bacterium]